MAFPWIIMMVLILVIIVTLAIIFFYKNKGKKQEPDYFTFYIMGLIWLPFGIIWHNWTFSLMGLVFMIIGLVHKDKWKQNHVAWDKVPPERRRMMFIGIGLGLLVLLGLVAYLFLSGI